MSLSCSGSATRNHTHTHTHITPSPSGTDPDNKTTPVRLPAGAGSAARAPSSLSTHKGSPPTHARTAHPSPLSLADRPRVGSQRRLASNVTARGRWARRVGRRSHREHRTGAASMRDHGVTDQARRRASGTHGKRLSPPSGSNHQCATHASVCRTSALRDATTRARQVCGSGQVRLAVELGVTVVTDARDADDEHEKDEEGELPPAAARVTHNLIAHLRPAITRVGGGDRVGGGV